LEDLKKLTYSSLKLVIFPSSEGTGPVKELFPNHLSTQKSHNQLVIITTPVHPKFYIRQGESIQTNLIFNDGGSLVKDVLQSYCKLSQIMQTLKKEKRNF
jgi:hypothetical protein